MVDLGILAVTAILWAKCNICQRIYSHKVDGGMLFGLMDTFLPVFCCFIPFHIHDRKIKVSLNAWLLEVVYWVWKLSLCRDRQSGMIQLDTTFSIHIAYLLVIIGIGLELEHYYFMLLFSTTWWLWPWLTLIVSLNDVFSFLYYFTFLLLVKLAHA